MSSSRFRPVFYHTLNDLLWYIFCHTHRHKKYLAFYSLAITHYMMPMLNLRLLPCLLVLALFIFFFPTCKEKDCTDATNPDCPNYNPCLTAKEANAEFIIVDSLRPSVGVYATAFQIDTFWPTNNIYFKALHENDTYEWKIGTDARTFTQRLFTLTFDPNLTGNIPVRLITTRKVPAGCAAGDVVRDTFYQNLFLVEYFSNRDKLPILGTYRGYDNDLKDSLFTITIGYNEFYDKQILNFPRECKDAWEPVRPLLSWRNFYVGHNGGECGFPIGIGRLQADYKTLIIDYTTQYPTGGNGGSPVKTRRFIGTKQ